jgi:alkylation response protein AidB-like acyl-CoA dehydrogenase
MKSLTPAARPEVEAKAREQYESGIRRKEYVATTQAEGPAAGLQRVQRDIDAKKLTAYTELPNELIADSAMEMYQCKLMVLHAAYKIENKMDFTSEVSMAKHFVANSLWRIIDRAIQVHGALGYSTDTPLAHMLQQARWSRFADGADEIHQMRIAQRTIAAYKDYGTTKKATGDLPL